MRSSSSPSSSSRLRRGGSAAASAARVVGRDRPRPRRCRGDGRRPGSRPGSGRRWTSGLAPRRRLAPDGAGADGARRHRAARRPPPTRSRSPAASARPARRPPSTRPPGPGRTARHAATDVATSSPSSRVGRLPPATPARGRLEEGHAPGAVHAGRRRPVGRGPRRRLGERGGQPGALVACRVGVQAGPRGDVGERLERGVQAHAGPPPPSRGSGGLSRPRPPAPGHPAHPSHPGRPEPPEPPGARPRRRPHRAAAARRRLACRTARRGTARAPPGRRRRPGSRRPGPAPWCGPAGRAGR